MRGRLASNDSRLNGPGLKAPMVTRAEYRRIRVGADAVGRVDLVFSTPENTPGPLRVGWSLLISVDSNWRRVLQALERVSQI